MVGLMVGDHLEDDTLFVTDEDRLCFQVLSISRGAQGVRTISKSLLSEWIEAVRIDPNADSATLRERLCGKTAVDKFEYGYYATLKKMADMALGNVTVIHAPKDLSEEFCIWFANNRGKGSDNTARKYLGYFKTLTSPYQQPTNSYWYGLYRIMYGRDAVKEVVEIDSVGEFKRLYGDVVVALENKILGQGMDEEGCARAIEWYWAPEVKSHTCVTSALNAYRSFLEWRGVDADILERFRNWLSSPERNSGKGYKEKTIKRYVDALVAFDNVLDAWGVELGGRKLHQITDHNEFAGVELRIRSCKQFAGYNDNLDENGKAQNLNGTGNGDPSAVLIQFRKYLEEGNEKHDETCATIDILDLSIRLFKEHRQDDDWYNNPDKPDWGYRSVNELPREYFRKLSERILNLNVDEVGEENLRSIGRELFLGVFKDGKCIFKPMWSGSNGSGWDSIRKGLDDDPKKTIGWVKKYASSAADVLTFATKEDDKLRPSGFGKSVESELLMKFHPDVAMKCGSITIKVYQELGLMKFNKTSDYSADEYTRVLGLAADIKQRLDAIGVTQMIGNKAPTDYITVNEFIAWVGEHGNLIKEREMSEKLKPVNSKSTMKNGSRKLSDAFENDELLKRLAAALRTKPFAILAGHSGTGKSQLVRRLAYMTCNNENLIKEGENKTAPGNYCMVQVKPNWHDSTDLIGYYSDLSGRHFVNTPFVQFLCKAYAYPDTPFFLCLDEMNLAPVEQYFAEYLSAVESLESKESVWVSDSLIEIAKTGEQNADGTYKVDEEILGQIMRGAQSVEAADWIRKHGLTIPKNLFVVGTVNMDETTCQFSRKVLDRAMTLLMNEVKFADMGKSKELNKEELLDKDGIDFFLTGGRRGDVGTNEAGLLDNLNKSLQNTPFVVAYRFANEYALYEEALANLDGVTKPTEPTTEEQKVAYRQEVEKRAVDALDHVVMMKLLPRIHGMKDVVKGIFDGRKVEGVEISGLKSVVKENGLCSSMMQEILNRGEEYLTFWP